MVIVTINLFMALLSFYFNLSMKYGMTWQQHCTRLICTKQVMNLDTEHLPTEIRYLFIPDECIEFPCSSTSVKESQLTNMSDEDVWYKKSI